MYQSVLGMLRIKNESRWIADVIASIVPVCEKIFIFDDHSSDNTVEICRSFGDQVEVIESPYSGLDESRDKNHLLKRLYEHMGFVFEFVGDSCPTLKSKMDWFCCIERKWFRIGIRAGFSPVIGNDSPNWALCIDGDEVLEPGGAAKINASIESGVANAYSLRVLYLWDSPDQVRVDGVYRKFSRPSLFRLINPAFSFQTTRWGGNLHCSSIPQEFLGQAAQSDAALLHYGYLYREDRIRKYDWYRTIDPGNHAEDGYRHVVQGDIPEVPAHMTLMHAGPLDLRALSTVL